MSTTEKTLGWESRPDGSRHPDDRTQRAMLQSNVAGARRDYDLSLGDLAILACCHGLYSAPQPLDCQVFENSVLETLAAELRVLAAALSTEGADSDQPELIELTHDELVRMVNALARRTRAAAEFGKRLRDARWGKDPSFGGESPEFTEGEPAEEPEK
jgi:hypothetical protein